MSYRSYEPPKKSSASPQPRALHFSQHLPPLRRGLLEYRPVNVQQSLAHFNAAAAHHLLGRREQRLAFWILCDHAVVAPENRRHIPRQKSAGRQDLTEHAEVAA